MDVPVTMTATQLTLIWMLLGGLFIWTVFFAYLALRPERKRAGSVQSSPTLSMLPTTPAPVKLQMLATTPVSLTQANTDRLQHEVNETHQVPVRIS